MTAINATDLPRDHIVAEASWAMPSREAPFDLYLRGTDTAIDTQTIKAAPIADRLTAAVEAFGKAGLDGTKRVAVYDRVGLFSAPWVWWLLRSHGCDAVLIEGWGETEETPPLVAPKTFMPTNDATTMNATTDDVRAALGSDIQILDARPAGRFRGDIEEPRPGCRAGHIPGSLNIPFPSLKSGRAFHKVETLNQLFADAGVDLSKPIITTCGSGVTASGLAFALTCCGADHVRVYQGSWAEWGMDDSLPIETGS